MRTQAVYKEGPNHGNKRKKKPKKEKVKQQPDHPTNSEKRDSPSPSPEIAETAQEETEERVSSSSYLTSLPLGRFFDFTLPKYTKTDK